MTTALSERTENDVSGDADDIDPIGRRGWLAPVLAILAGMAAIAWHVTRYGHWIVDDAAITFSYSRSLAEGLGPVLQPGATPVEGYSDPTWMVLLALGRLVGLFDHGTLFGIPDYVLFPKLLGMVFIGGILAACHVAARQLFRHAWVTTLVVGLTLAAIPSFVIWCCSGLENSLFAMVVTWLAVLLFTAVRRAKLLTLKVALAAGVLVAFAALTRPDGLIYAAAYPAIALVRLRRPVLGASVKHILVSLAAFAVPFGAYVVWRYVEFGRLLSNPAVAKGQGLPGFEMLERPGELVQYVGVFGVAALVLTIGFALFRAPWRAELIALLVPLALAVTAFAALKPDWMAQHRFATPVWPLAVLAGTLSAAEILRRVRIRARILVVVGLVAAAIPSAVGFAAASDDFTVHPTVPACMIADRFGRGFNTYADILGLRDASLLLPDLGGSSMTSRLHLVDMAGLVEKNIAEFIRNNDYVGLRNYVFEDVKPTFVHSWGPWTANGISTDPRLDRDYEWILIYPLPGPRNGDWVRKDAVSDPEKLRAVRAYANPTMFDVEQSKFRSGLQDCGPDLRPGETVGAP